MKTFQEWLKIKKEGLWVSDSNAESTSGGVRAQKKSKDAAPAAGSQGQGGVMGQAPAMGGGMGGGMSMPPK